jgi:ribosomal protein L19
VNQLLTDKSKDEKGSRTQAFEGTVIGIRGQGLGKSFIVRRIGANNIGIEQIFPISAPVIDSVEVVRAGTRGSRRAKLYYIRDKSKREIENIYSRTKRREAAKLAKQTSKKKTVKKATKKATKKTSKKTSPKKS